MSDNFKRNTRNLQKTFRFAFKPKAEANYLMSKNIVTSSEKFAKLSYDAIPLIDDNLDNFRYEKFLENNQHNDKKN